MFNKTTSIIILSVFCFTQTSFAAPYKAQNLRGQESSERGAKAGGEGEIQLALLGAANALTQPVLAAARGNAVGMTRNVFMKRLRELRRDEYMYGTIVKVDGGRIEGVRLDLLQTLDVLWEVHGDQPPASLQYGEILFLESASAQAPGSATGAAEAGAIGWFKKKDAAEQPAAVEQTSLIAAVLGKADTGITGRGYDKLLQQMKDEGVLVYIRWKDLEGVNVSTNGCRVVSFNANTISVIGGNAPAMSIIHRDAIYFIGTDPEQAKQAQAPQSQAKSKATGEDAEGAVDINASSDVRDQAFKTQIGETMSLANETALVSSIRCIKESVDIQAIKERVENGVAVIISPDTVIDTHAFTGVVLI